MFQTDSSGSSKWLRALLCAAGLFQAAIASSGHAESVAEFYRGRTITLVVGSSAGGGYDHNARLFARFLTRHIPGQPQIVVQNMPGASSIVATDYVYSIAPKDGTVISTVQRPIPFARLSGDANIRFDVTKMNWLGSTTSEPGVVIAWATAPQKTAKDLFRMPMIVGGTGAGADPEIFAHALNNLIETKFQIVSGYPGQAETLLAMERGEIQGLANLSWTDVAAVRPAWITGRKVNLLMQVALTPAVDLPDVPLATEFAPDPRRRLILETILEMKQVGRPYFMAPAVPADRVAAMRAAFDETMDDPDYRRAVMEDHGTVDPVGGKAMQEMVTKLAAEPADFISAARAALR